MWDWTRGEVNLCDKIRSSKVRSGAAAGESCDIRAEPPRASTVDDEILYEWNYSIVSQVYCKPISYHIVLFEFIT